MNRILILCLVFFCLTPHFCNAHPIKQSHHNVDAAIWAAVSYCCDLRGDPTHVCIGSAAGGIDSRLIHKIQGLGAKVVGSKWVETATLSGSMMYLEVGDFSWISKRRAKVQIYIAEPLDSEPGRRLEAVGDLYVVLEGGKWIVDGKAGGLRTIS